MKFLIELEETVVHTYEIEGESTESVNEYIRQHTVDDLLELAEPIREASSSPKWLMSSTRLA